VLAAALGTAVGTVSDPAALTARIDIDAAAAGDLVAHALSRLSGADITVSALEFGQPSLDEVFLVLTGHRAPEPSLQAVTS
jgi:hypothetical protein